MIKTYEEHTSKSGDPSKIEEFMHKHKIPADQIFNKLVFEHVNPYSDSMEHAISVFNHNLRKEGLTIEDFKAAQGTPNDPFHVVFDKLQFDAQEWLGQVPEYGIIFNYYITTHIIAENDIELNLYKDLLKIAR